MNDILCAAGKLWGPQDKQPLIALHGWQDNAASFDPLMSLLPESLNVLAVDLPGHGLSSHYPPSCMYHFTDSIFTLRHIVQHFKWKTISIIGHSMGASFAFLYAAFYPKEVEKILCFDIVRPICIEPTQIETTSGAYVDNFITTILNKSDPPEYTVDDIVERQFKASNGSISKASSRVLLTRGSFKSKKDENLIGLTRDIRLKHWPIIHTWPHEFLLEMASRIECEVLNIKSKPGMYYEKPKYYEQTLNIIRKSAKRVVYHEVPGSHHAHLNNPEYFAPHVADFLHLDSK